MTGNDRKSKEMEGVGTQVQGKQTEKQFPSKITQRKKNDMKWKEIEGNHRKERKRKEYGKKE